VLDTGERMVRANEASVMVAGRVEEDEAAFLVLAGVREPGPGVLCSVPEARSLASANHPFAELVRRFPELRQERDCGED
jgi:hypothetical protein